MQKVSEMQWKAEQRDLYNFGKHMGPVDPMYTGTAEAVADTEEATAVAVAVEAAAKTATSAAVADAEEAVAATEDAPRDSNDSGIGNRCRHRRSCGSGRS